MITKQRDSGTAAVDEYIAGFDGSVQSILRKVRRTVRKAAPKAREVLSYRMPALKQYGVLIYYAAFKNHLGLYPPIKGEARLASTKNFYKKFKSDFDFSPFTLKNSV